VSLLEEGLYHADGQILDEVYEYGSFLQSRMGASGVVCTDCHDPHSTRLRAEGNAVCATCHQASVFDTPTHHHHRQGTEAAQCVSCHMAARLYMIVDARRDHSFRVPRPDLSVTFGTPNACSDCHRARSPAWAAEVVVKWYGLTRRPGPNWAGAIAAGRRWQVGADKLLAEVASQPTVPPIVRASAIALLARFPYAVQGEFVKRVLRDPDPLVRRAGLGLLFALEPPQRWQIGSPLLADPMRTVRLEAVNALAELPAALSLPPGERAAFTRVVEEYRAAQGFNADRAEAWLNLGALEARLGRFDRAEAAYERAIQLQPAFMPAYVNLADLYRGQGREEDGERVLREALARQPEVAEVHHALGLLLVRRKRMPEALGELATAAKLEREVPRYTYVHAIALDSTGQHAQARAVLAEAQARFPGDRDILAALVQLSLQAGDRGAAARWAKKLRELDDGAH
jgi:predicted CXXCH cytochrome family protein